jgi:Uma2 family endonuclease
VDEHGLGVVFASGAGFQIASDPDTVLAPAVAFVKMDHAELGDGYHSGPPDLAIEIVSELDDPAFVPAVVVDEWLKAGCRCVTVVDPFPETVTVYRSSTDVQELSGKTFWTRAISFRDGSCRSENCFADGAGVARGGWFGPATGEAFEAVTFRR